MRAGDLFRVETVDWTGGQIGDNDDASDVRDVDLTRVHYLSGPIDVHDAAGAPAQPGDLLCVEICNLGPLPGDEWGFTGVQQLRAAFRAGALAEARLCCRVLARATGTFDRDNGGGFLTDHFPGATKAIWNFEGAPAVSCCACCLLICCLLTFHP